MFINQFEPGSKMESEEDVFGVNPPRGVYFVMDVDFNMNHPINRSRNMMDSNRESAPMRTMIMAQSVARSTAVELSQKLNLSLVTNEAKADYDSGYMDLPSYIGVDLTANEPPHSIVFTASVRFVDTRDEISH